MHVTIKVRLRSQILDPQGKTIEQTLHHLEFDKVSRMRVGKLIECELDIDSIEEAYDYAEKMAQKLLVNQVMEDYEISVEPTHATS